MGMRRDMHVDGQSEIQVRVTGCEGRGGVDVSGSGIPDGTLRDNHLMMMKVKGKKWSDASRRQRQKQQKTSTRWVRWKRRF
jgi:hypothetical protein